MARSTLTRYYLEAKTDNTSSGGRLDNTVALAWLRGRLRLTVAISNDDSKEQSATSETDARPQNYDGETDAKEWVPAAPIGLAWIAKWIEKTDLPASG